MRLLADGYFLVDPQDAETLRFTACVFSDKGTVSFLMMMYRVLSVYLISALLIPSAAPQLRARVVNGTAKAGRLEVSYGGGWKTVCDDDFGEEEASVACRMLGFNSTGQAAAKFPMFGTGSGFQFSYIKCQGMENSLEQCELGQLRNSDCFDVGILCDARSMSLRLTGPHRTSTHMGRVEVETGSNQYSTVCVNDEKTATVICRQLNLPSRNAALIDGWLFGGKKSPLLEVAFVCDGNENSLDECRWNKTTEDCYSNNAGVTCSRDDGLHIVTEDDMYPFLEGTKGSLMCVTPRNYHQVFKYEWADRAGGLPQENLLIFDNLTRKHNGRQVYCLATYVDSDYDPVNNIGSGYHTLKVYYQPLIRITWTDNTSKQHPLSNLTELSPGQNVTLWCEADSNPPPASITWSGRVNSTTGELRIIAADHVTHSGLYICTVVTQTVDDDDRLPLTSSYQLTLSVQVEEIKARLVNGTTSTGRLEIFHKGEWSTVCDDSFGNEEAKVACWMLGFNSSGAEAVASSIYGAGSGKILLDEVNCTGTEISLAECTHKAFYSHDCSHSEDVGVICKYAEQLEARVVNGTAASGRLEIFHNGQWSTVCDDGFGNEEAEVACRMLGFDSSRATAVSSSTYGEGSGKILLDNVDCRGTEMSFSQCTHTALYSHDCKHSEDVGVICNDVRQLIARLANGNENAGRLEIFHNGQWSTVCNDGFGNEEAGVACRMLGFDSSGAKAVASRIYGLGSGRILLDDVKCTGTEISLAECTHRPLYSHNCGHSEDVGVICKNETSEVTKPTGATTVKSNWEFPAVPKPTTTTATTRVLSSPKTTAGPRKDSSTPALTTTTTTTEKVTTVTTTTTSRTANATTTVTTSTTTTSTTTTVITET